jgi:predicted secreted protein
MADDQAVIGRKVIFEWDSSQISGIREKGIKIDGSPVDVTSEEDDGWMTLLEDPGENKVEISLSGVLKSDVLKNAWFSGSRTKPISLTYPSGAEMSGTFFLASYSEKGTYKEGVTFEGTLQSSGRVVWTPYA